MSDLERIQGGEGAKFNSSIADLERIHNLLMVANEASINNNVITWWGALRAFDREITTYLNEDEKKQLDQARVKGIPKDFHAQDLVRSKLNDYENELRLLRSKKKLGIVAEDDASTAALR
mgnify:CR=1 FL=1